MPKQKSSASSATKKKHARRTAAREEQLAARAAEEELAELQEQDNDDDGNDDDAASKPDVTAADGAAAAADDQAVPVNDRPVEAASTPAIVTAETTTTTSPPTQPLVDKRGKRIKDIPPSGNSRGQKNANAENKKKKQSKKHAKGQAPPPPRKKQYIPPPKPVKTNVDPVDTYGLGIVGAGYERIPAEKVVSLRLLNKKDSMSVERGLDELLAWVNEVQKSDSSDEEALTHLSEVIPVWAHHLPRLLSHASRRVRYLTTSIHAILLHQGSSDLLSYTVPAFTTPSNLEREDFLSCQLCATFDPDRQVRSLSIANWKALSDIVPPQNYLEEILNSLTDSILESSSTSSADEKARKKLSDEERIAMQEEQDREINHLTASIEAFASMLQYCTFENVSLFSKVTSSESFWSFLSSKEMEAPQVRRSTWRTLALSLSHEQLKALLEDSLSDISRIAPRAAFSERDHQTQNTLWEPLISLFRAHSSIWKRPIPSSDSEDESSDSESDSGSSPETDASTARSGPSKITQTIAAFFDLLQVGFYGNASSGYQATPLLIHTIPSNILPRTSSNLESLFSSYWAAYAGGAIDSSSTPAFVRCLIDIVRLSLTSDEAAEVAAAQLTRLWEYYLHITPPPTKYLSLTSSTTIEELEKGLVSIQSKYASAFDKIWKTISETAKQTAVASESKSAALAQALVQMFRSSSKEISQRAQKLLHECVALAASNSDGKGSAKFLLEALAKDGKELLITPEVHQPVDKYMLNAQPEQHQLLTTYFQARGSTDAATDVWKHLCESLRSGVPSKGFSQVLPYLEAFHSGLLSSATFSNAEMDEIITAHALETLSTDPALHRALEILLHTPQPIASEDFPRTLLTRLVDFLETQLSSITSSASYSVPQDKVSVALKLLSLADADQLYATVAHYPSFVTLFQWAELVPEVIALNEDVTQQARSICDKMVSKPVTWSLADLYAMTATRLGELLTEKQCYISPVTLSEAYFKLCRMPNANRSHLMLAFLPQEQEMSKLASRVFEESPNQRLAVLHPLLITQVNSDKLDDDLQNSASRKLYQRTMLAWLAVLSENRRLGAQVDWFLPHAILVREVSGDIMAVSEQTDEARPDLEALKAVSDRVAIYMSSQIIESSPETWQSAALKAWKDGGQPDSSPARLLSELFSRVTHSPNGSYASRVLSASLTMLLHQSGASLPEREGWLDLAKTWQKKDLRLCLAIIDGLGHSLSSSTRLQRYQGEVASSLTNIKPSEVATSGASQLQLLLALAYASTSDEDLLPANRAIFLLQAFQKWHLFDIEAEGEEGEEALDVAGPLIIRVCTQLVSAIQDLSGAHWDFMFDIVEYLIESFSWEQASTYAGLSAACALLEEMHNRASSNRAFRGLVRSSLARSSKLLAPLFLSAPDSTDVTIHLLGAMSRLLTEPDTFASSDLPALFLLLPRMSGPSLAALFDISSQAIRKEVDDLTIKAETRRRDETEAVIPLGIPSEIIALLDQHSADPPASESDAAKMLLSWLLISQFFQDTTTTLKTLFTEQVRKTGFIAKALLPSIFAYTNVSERSRGLDLSGWQVEDFLVSDLDNPDSEALSRLAAHAYYQTLRAVPSLVRSEWESIKNKQLSMSIETFTSRAFSPLLVDYELAKVHAEEAKGTLQDEEMSIKVLPNVNEVKAIYTVDEQPMEIAVRIPPNFPLSPVEVKDVKRIGVPEATWRAWLLNVQLIISTQNGSIADALSLFKTNASRHFEGVEACAICYSVVSVTDRSMPTKRCRTCKQLFHPSCLYKWFATSHGSSCPLCRSLF